MGMESMSTQVSSFGSPSEGWTNLAKSKSRRTFEFNQADFVSPSSDYDLDKILFKQHA